MYDLFFLKRNAPKKDLGCPLDKTFKMPERKNMLEQVTVQKGHY
jgi:hypothetical protein